MEVSLVEFLDESLDILRGMFFKVGKHLKAFDKERDSDVSHRLSPKSAKASNMLATMIL